MVFTKHLKALDYNDIDNLKQRGIPESDILDYKKEIIDDEKLVKHVSAFANTSGGYIIFGIEETGHGGVPADICGVDKTSVKKERMEQIILSNVNPRLNVKFSNMIELPSDPDKCVLVLQIPDSYLKPHMNTYSGKYYKRYNFESTEMTELEIGDAYKKRFETYRELDKEISNMRFVLGGPVRMPGQIIVIPTIIRRDLIDTSDEGNFTWINPGGFEPKPLSSNIEWKYVL